MKPSNSGKKYAAEAVSTFCLVFCGTGAIAVNEITGGMLSHVGVSLVFGLIVLAMIYAVGHISGAHMNPAVTLAFASVGRMTRRDVVLYLCSQLVGALLASAMVAAVFKGNRTLGVTFPAGFWGQSFALEFILTFMLMFVIMGVAHNERAEGLMAGVAIGATVALEALIGGPISGASMNPVRSLAPALISGNLNGAWIYVAAPILGAVLGALVYKKFISINNGAAASPS